MGYNPQELLENTINTMGTPLGVHPIVPWGKALHSKMFLQENKVQVFQFVTFLSPIFGGRGEP